MSEAARPVVPPGLPLVVTRPRADAARLRDLLVDAGRDVIVFPVLDIEPVDDTTALADAFARIASYRLVVFVSSNAIRHGLAQRVAPWPRRVAIGVLGPGSVAVLAEHGIAAPQVRVVSPASETVGATPRFDSEALLAALDDVLAGADERPVLIVKGNGGRAWLRERLVERGIRVDTVESYRRVRPTPDAAAAARLRRWYADDADAGFVVTSSEGLEHLVALVVDAVGSPDARRWLLERLVIAPHARIAEGARRLGFGRIHVVAPGDRGIVAALR